MSFSSLKAYGHALTSLKDHVAHSGSIGVGRLEALHQSGFLYLRKCTLNSLEVVTVSLGRTHDVIAAL